MRPSPPFPPTDVLGGVVPVELVVVRTRTVFMALHSATAFPGGVVLLVEVAARASGLDMFPPDPQDEALFHVVYPDGTRAATYGRDRVNGSLLHLGGGTSADDRSMTGQWSLWLSPLPPPAPFTFGVEWPKFGIPEASVQVDGAAVVAASLRAQPYWA
ncbi:hypothetical protein ACIBG8_10930 [Nonomuraea sp. NPDC050556]|uniref:hypothetical protein n=1 Tax=Nonomuraea sp. NPDC050556 TaxID=3364369 RepID=UPI0037ACAF2E